MGQHSELESATDKGINLYEAWINAAYRDITTRDKFWNLKKSFYFPELETEDLLQTTTDGQRYIDTPTDCLFPQEVYDYTNKRQLDWMPWSEYVGKTDRFDSASRAEPKRWHRRGLYIYLYPTPDSDSDAIYIYYKQRVVDLITTKTTIIGPEWDEPILTLATIKGWSWRRDWDAVKEYRTEFLEQVANLVTVYGAEEKARRGHLTPDSRYYRKKRY